MANLNPAVIGLGSMGYGMAQSLLRAGHRTWGFDVVQRRMDDFAAEGGAQGALAEVAPGLDAAVIAVLNAAQTEAVLFGDGGLAGQLPAGACVLASATVPPEFAARMESQCNDLGLLYLDAPMSGGSVKAAAGQLSIMASGKPEAFAAAKPVLDAIAQTVFELGDSAGLGSAMKAVNQLLAGVHIASMGEALAFGIRQGIDPGRIVEVITQSAGNSWMFENRAPHVVAGDYHPHSAVDIWLKDLGIVLDIARQSRSSVPLTAAALQQFIAASGSGWGAEDDAAVTKVYARNAAIKLPGQD